MQHYTATGILMSKLWRSAALLWTSQRQQPVQNEHLMLSHRLHETVS
jgi:hypothetical protein